MVFVLRKLPQQKTIKNVNECWSLCLTREKEKHRKRREKLLGMFGFFSLFYHVSSDFAVLCDLKFRVVDTPMIWWQYMKTFLIFCCCFLQFCLRLHTIHWINLKKILKLYCNIRVFFCFTFFFIVEISIFHFNVSFCFV